MRSIKLPEYNIEFVESAAKEFRALPPDVKRRVSDAADSLKQNPRPRGSIKLKGHNSLYRIRVGVYRLIYAVEDSIRLVQIRRIRHRREAYN